MSRKTFSQSSAIRQHLSPVESMRLWLAAEHSQSTLILLTSLFVAVSGNVRFLTNLLAVYPFNWTNGAFLISISLLLFCVNTLLLALICYRFTIKPVLALFLLSSAATAYFMDTYNVIIDDVMIDNIMRTDRAEVANLFSLKQAMYLVLLGVIPALLVLRARLRPASFSRAVLARLKLGGFTLVATVLLLLSFGSAYASFFREHKLLRFYANPTYPIWAAGNYLAQLSPAGSADTVTPIALDAVQDSPGSERKLLVVVVGETVRADHLSLNGYERNTNPLLAQEDVISFSNVWSCGTSTAVSLPCMFSNLTRENYDAAEALSTENVLDVLSRAGINVTWLDNNSDSKGVALRIPFESFKSESTNRTCDAECRDVGMLDYLRDFIADHPEGDILVVLHQMGNHGPAYYKRYPQEFEIFSPICQTNILDDCSTEEIINSYDNALTYTDYFLYQTIQLLKSNADEFDTGMVYIGDHGESLGEYGVYLHGLPYVLAPDSQKHVPMIMWFDADYKAGNLEIASLERMRDQHYTHDNVFHTLLGLTDVSTSVYDASLDIFASK